MRRSTAASLLAVTFMSGCANARHQNSPEARRSDHVDVYHGTRVPDPYRWMEDLNSAETRAWAHAQDEHARRFAAASDQHAPIHARLERIADVERYTAPRHRGGRYIYLRFGASGFGPGTSIEVRDGLNASPRTLVGADEIARLGHDAGLVRMAPDRDGRVVAYGLSREGSNWISLRFRDVETGLDLPDTLVNLHRTGSSLSWSADGRGLYYETFDRPPAGEERRARLRNERILFHVLGTSQNEDRLVYQPVGEPDAAVVHSISDDGRYLVIGVRRPGTMMDRILYRDLTRRGTTPVQLITGEDAAFTFVGNNGPVFWFQTDLDAPRGRVIGIDTRAPERAHWQEIIPQAEDAISSWVGVTAIGGRLVVGYLHDARLVVRVFDPHGRPLYDLKLPHLGSIWSGFSGRQSDSVAFYQLSGLVDPGSIYRLNVRTGRSALFARADLGYDPDDFVTDQVFYKGKDGTRIPMYVAYRKDLQKDGRTPVYIYGYGFGSWSAAPWFQPNMAVWLQMGGIWALPNIRGGGEYGEAWHRAGSGQHKQTAIDDYIAACEWLISAGYTTPELLVANASSAGGAIGGAAITQRPDLYGAAILDFPILDMLRYDQFTGARRWRSDYGTADDPADFRALLAYSPYHNVQPGTCYPATLVAPGEQDETTPPLHAYKFVAALQHAQNCDAPILLRVSWGAGHSFGADLASSIDNWADQLAFLTRVLGRRGWTPRL